LINIKPTYLVTQLTLVWSLASVTPHVDHAVPWSLECLAADRARVWFNAGVCRHVCCQDIRPRESPTALLAAVRTLACIIQNFTLHIHCVPIEAEPKFKNTHTHTPIFSGTTQVSPYEKGKNQSGFYSSKRQ